MTSTQGAGTRPDDSLRGLAAESLARAAGPPPPILSHPQPGQLLIWTDSAQPVQWLVLEARDLPQRAIKLAAVDAFGVRGTTDLAVRETLTGAELSLRGAHSLWLTRENLPGARHCGEVGAEDLSAIREQLDQPTLSFSTLDVDAAADYAEWMEGVVRPSLYELEELVRAVEAVSQQPQPRSWNRQWPRAAAALLLLAVGFVAGLTLQNLKREPLSESSSPPSGPVSSSFAPLSPLTVERGESESPPYRLAAGDSYYTLLLALQDSPLEGGLVLSFEDHNDPSTAFEASQLEQIVVDGRRYVSVVVPGALLAAGRWELVLTGELTPAERLRYALIVE